MKFSSKVQRCGLSPMRKFHPYAVAAKAAGKKVYHLNIGQPDIETPPVYFQAIQDFSQKVLEYAESPGIPELIRQVRSYYARLGVELAEEDVLVTTGGSEALQIVCNCILEEGDEIIIPEPFYPNYNTFVCTAGASIRPIPTTPEEGYLYAAPARIEAAVNEPPPANIVTSPGH
ncbi:MAG: aminotransferase class I/II-fold pyridoxal phosphate-dependent enzyme, partial [Oscillospiraceae bacterium]|nr:aminotransferase class I/II-fold pyridoxal phosphate-dependent enzyme [Oscillospiraceae bacterium]